MNYLEWINSKVFFYSARHRFFPGKPTPADRLPVMVISAPLASAPSRPTHCLHALSSDSRMHKLKWPHSPQGLAPSEYLS